MQTRDIWVVIAACLKDGERASGDWYGAVNPRLGEVETTISGGMDWLNWRKTGIMPNPKGWRDRYIWWKP